VLATGLSPPFLAYGTAIYPELAAGAALAGAALLAPALLPAVGALPLAGGALVARRATWTRRRRWESLEQRVRDQQELADRLSASLEDLVSDLRLDDVLEKITHHARAAVVGKEFVLLAPGEEGFACLGSSGVAPDAIQVLERWADATPDLIGTPVSLDNLREVPQLAALTGQRAVAFGSLHAAPLTFRGRSLGVLVALAHGPSGFLPVDVTLLQSYAAQASIALANAHMVERLERLASQDPLTGLLNHREFHEGVARELERSRRCGGRFSVVLVDLDDFKRVNDEAGHAAGDQVLRQVAGAIVDSCRVYDSGFRIGGDEFALVLPETDSVTAAAVAERVERTIEERDLPVRATCGVAEYPLEAPTRELLLARADADLYVAKRARAAEERARAFAGAAGSRRAAEVRDFEHRRRVAGGRLNGSSEVVRRLLATAREQLGLDLALLNEFLDDRLVVRAVEGGDGWLAIEPEITFPLEESFCVRVADGRIPPLIADVQRDPRLARLALVSQTDIGSYLGVPVHLSDGSLYGTFALLGREPALGLGEREVSLARALAALTAGELERAGQLDGVDSRLRVEVTGVHALIAALDARDRYTGKHSKTVVGLSSMVARSLALSDDEVDEVEQVAMLHDIGKVGIPDSVLHKEAPLDDAEWAIMREHPVIGARIISSIEGLAHLAPLIRAEHESWDGSGYPDGLAGEEIPIASRIVFACDAYHAMTSDRPYRQALSASAAIDEVRRCAGRQFDPAVAAALVQVLQPAAA
jgi:diguanylate cyclase (GGDEF)-like protein